MLILITLGYIPDLVSNSKATPKDFLAPLGSPDKPHFLILSYAPALYLA